MAKGRASRRVQKALEKEVKLKAELRELDRRIEVYEDRTLGKGCMAYNLMKGQCCLPTKSNEQLSLPDEHRIFSLSSITSRVSMLSSRAPLANLIPDPDLPRFGKALRTPKSTEPSAMGGSQSVVQRNRLDSQKQGPKRRRRHRKNWYPKKKKTTK